MGDSLGAIHIFDTSHLQFNWTDSIFNEELEGDCINYLMHYNHDHDEGIDETAAMLGNKCLIVHSRDNSIKLLKRKKGGPSPHTLSGKHTPQEESRWMVFSRFIGSKVEK